MQNYFSLFRLPEQFALDEHQLQHTYRQLAAQFHPDKFAAASVFEQKQAVMMSALVNEAYRVLSQPLDRAAYFLNLKYGVNPDAPEHTQFAPEFLMQQLEWRETLMDAKMANNRAELDKLAHTIQTEQDQLLSKLQAACEENQVESAAQLIRQGRFLHKLSVELTECRE